MRTHTLRGVWAGMCLLWAAGAVHAAPGIPWAKSYQAAMAEAKKTNKLVMIDFYTDWCGWCKKLDEDTYTNKKVIQLAAQFVPVKLNAEKEGTAAAKKYRVEGFPTIMFINASGAAEGKIVGYLPPEPFAQQMTQLAEAHRTLPKMEARLKAKPDDVEAAAKLAAIYAGRGDAARATAMLEQAEKADTQNATGHLTKAYNALGDYFQEKEEFDKAIPLFRKAADTSKAPDDVAYARISIASCYLSQHKFQEATPELEAIVNDPHSPDEMKKNAQQMLDQIKKGSTGDK